MISLNHVLEIIDFKFSTIGLGFLGWLTIGLSVYYLSNSFKKQALFIFIIFFCLGYFTGPFLEPPADPIDHLNKSYAFINKTNNEISNKNGGLWTYSMNHLFLTTSKKYENPDTTLMRIDILNGLYYGLLMVVLFILAKASDLPDNWAFLSCIIAFLFFGTNRFSYFSYYSIAPSALSMLIYWLWISVFFCKQ